MKFRKKFLKILIIIMLLPVIDIPINQYSVSAKVNYDELYPSSEGWKRFGGIGGGGPLYYNRETEYIGVGENKNCLHLPKLEPRGYLYSELYKYTGNGMLQACGGDPNYAPTRRKGQIFGVDFNIYYRTFPVIHTIEEIHCIRGNDLITGQWGITRDDTVYYDNICSGEIGLDEYVHVTKLSALMPELKFKNSWNKVYVCRYDSACDIGGRVHAVPLYIGQGATIEVRPPNISGYTPVKNIRVDLKRGDSQNPYITSDSQGQVFKRFYTIGDVRVSESNAGISLGSDDGWDVFSFYYRMGETNNKWCNNCDDIEDQEEGKGSVTINHKTEDGNLLENEYKKDLELNKDYKFSAKTFTNYKVLGASEKTVKLSKSNPNQTIEFIYKKIDENIPDPPIDIGDDGGGGGGGGGDGDDPSCEELGTCPPPLPDPVHLTPCSGGACEPTLVTVAKPKYVQPDYGDISINLSNYLRDLPMDKTNNTGTQVDDLFNKGTADKISIKYTNIPVDGNLNYTGEEFKPSLTVRTKNYTLQIPANGSNNTVKTKTTTDYWSKYQSEGIKTDLIIYPVKDPSNLPTSKQQFFNLPSSEYIFKTTVTNKNTNLDNFKITKSGYYILGARLQGNGQTVIELVPLKISFSNENNWLPLPNNLSIQLNEHMLVTPSKRDDHNSSNLMCPGKNSLKVPSSYNNKYGITAIGSSNNGGLKLYDSEMNNFTLANTTINNNDSITGILETPVGFIVSTSNNGIHYIDLATKKSFKIKNLPYNDINSLTEHKGKIVMTTSNGLVVGDLNMYFDSNNNIDSIVFTDVNPNKNFISSSELFGSTIQVGEVNNVMDKIVVAPKTSSGPATLKIVDTK